jgi:hypothetical protein
VGAAERRGTPPRDCEREGCRGGCGRALWFTPSAIASVRGVGWVGGRPGVVARLAVVGEGGWGTTSCPVCYRKNVRKLET